MTALSYYPQPRCVLGEAPLWDSSSARLHWVDCDHKVLFRLDPKSDAITSTQLAHSPGCYAFRARGGMIMAYRNQLALIDLPGFEHSVLEATGVDFAVERFNDGACDRKGRLWVGTMDRRLRDPLGALFRIDPDFSVHRMESGITASNGIAFSPDDSVMYHTDTGAATIYAYDFDLARGTLGNRRVFADFRGEHGRPDGCTIDAEGHLWVAEVNGGRIVRLDPSGRRVREIELPVTRPTCPMFGGDDLRTLYVTSMQHGLTKEDLERQPQAGCLFSVRLDVPGLPEPYFAG